MVLSFKNEVVVRFDAVKVFAADPSSRASQDGKIRNLLVKTKDCDCNSVCN